MEIKDSRIDAGKAFDWGRTSKEYARYRDIYPEKFYRKVIDRGLCVKGQRVLDLGTGTGVLPRNLYSYGAEWTGTDISPEQIEQAKILSEAADMKIDFQVVPAEEISFPHETFDVITACQCFWYFDHEKLIPKIKRQEATVKTRVSCFFLSLRLRCFFIIHICEGMLRDLRWIGF